MRRSSFRASEASIPWYGDRPQHGILICLSYSLQCVGSTVPLDAIIPKAAGIIASLCRRPVDESQGAWSRARPG